MLKFSPLNAREKKGKATPVVTASVDRLDFLAPAKMGEMICLKSSVNFTGAASMEVGVRIESENAITGKVKHTASAYLTFVSLDENKKPKKVESVKPVTDEEIRRFNEGEQRYIHRKNRRNKS